jgi:hypothetical protein
MSWLDYWLKDWPAQCMDNTMLNRYITWKCVKITFSSCLYLCNCSTSDIGMFGYIDVKPTKGCSAADDGRYIDVNWSKECSPKAWHIRSETFCIQRRVTGCPCFKLYYEIMLLLHMSGDLDFFLYIYINNIWFFSWNEPLSRCLLCHQTWTVSIP